MVRTAAETFFYNFSESKFFKDESKYLRVQRQVCTITSPPVDHLKIIDDLYKGTEIYMTLYPQKPGTYFGAEICRCQWKPQGCCVEVEQPVARMEDVVQQNTRPLPEKALRMKKSVVEPFESGPERTTIRAKSSVFRNESRTSTARTTDLHVGVLAGSETAKPFLHSNFLDRHPNKLLFESLATVCKEQNKSKTGKPLKMKKQSGGPDPDGMEILSTDASETDPPKKSTDGLPKSGRSVSRVTLQPVETRYPQKNFERRPTAVSQMQGRRRTTMGFVGIGHAKRSRSYDRSRSYASLARQDSPSPAQKKEPSSKKSVSKVGDSAVSYQCRKCTEKLCLKCRMPLDSCCCGIPNFLYCHECEDNMAGSAKNVGDPFRCRKCDQKLCLVCRQHVDSCCCPKPNFFVCRSCETRRRTRCCIPVQSEK